MSESAFGISHEFSKALSPVKAGRTLGVLRSPGTTVTRGNGTVKTTKQGGTWALKPKTTTFTRSATVGTKRVSGGGLTGKGKAAVAGAGIAGVGGAAAVKKSMAPMNPFKAFKGAQKPTMAKPKTPAFKATWQQGFGTGKPKPMTMPGAGASAFSPQALGVGAAKPAMGAGPKPAAAKPTMGAKPAAAAAAPKAPTTTPGAK